MYSTKSKVVLGGVGLRAFCRAGFRPRRRFQAKSENLLGELCAKCMQRVQNACRECNMHAVSTLVTDDM